MLLGNIQWNLEVLEQLLHMPRHKQYQLMEDFGASLREVDGGNELRCKIECKAKN